MGDALDRLLAGFGKQQQSKHLRDCAAIGCQQRVFGHALFCPSCWAKVPSDLQKLIGKHYRPGHAPSKVLLKWLQMAMDELLSLRTSGHYLPHTSSFMWDDPPAPSTEPDGALFEEPDATAKS